MRAGLKGKIKVCRQSKNGLFSTGPLNNFWNNYGIFSLSLCINQSSKNIKL